MLLQLKPVNANNANLDSRPQSKDDSDYSSPVRSIAGIADNGPDSILNSIRDISDESARYRDKRSMSNTSPT